MTLLNKKKYETRHLPKSTPTCESLHQITQVFSLMPSKLGTLKLPSCGGWSSWQLLRAARSAYTHLFIDLGQLNVVSLPDTAWPITPPTTSTNVILVPGVTELPALLSRSHLLLNELSRARWPKNVAGISTTVKVQRPLLAIDFERGPGSCLPHEMITEYRKALTLCH